MDEIENNIDTLVDSQLEECISNGSRKSFFLYAGAGSGKTHSLVELLKKIQKKWGETFQSQNRHIAVITYTNAATNEILRRLGNNELFHVSTIHSFVWRIISSYQMDLKKHYIQFKEDEIADLHKTLSETKNKTTKTYKSNQERLQSLIEKKDNALRIERFVYNPNGDNLESNSLTHADVIKISAAMLMKSMLLQKIVTQQYPFLLVDESQDTKKELVKALFQMQASFPDGFTLGFFGDVKQRIYTDGEENIKTMIPSTWIQPVKRMNYRCAKRIITLANKIGKTIDQHAEQYPREDAPEGSVRLFIVSNSETIDKDKIETDVISRMKEITGNDSWIEETDKVKTLVLEHLMAARRLGFAEFHEIMSKLHKYNMSYLQGEVADFALFTSQIFPLLQFLKDDRKDEALALMKKYSPLLHFEVEAPAFQQIRACNVAVNQLVELCEKNPNTTIKDAIQFIIDTKLFPVEDVLRQGITIKPEEIERPEELDETIFAWSKAMNIPLKEIKIYDDYVNRRTRFDTHQGVKGLEFERVLVIISDDESKGFLFNYDKLFGVKPLTETDEKNAAAGKDTSITRTTRLLYVTCTRAKESLALVLYTSNPQKAKSTAINNGWFSNDEVVLL
jgi:DNA helicase-2/ATP-dependent DNA helicase PcrA